MNGHESNNYPKALVNVPIEILTTRIIDLIRTIRPQVVVTHDPIGGYFHPDHVFINKAVCIAFIAANDPDFSGSTLPIFHPQKLYFNTISRTLLRWVVRCMPLFGKDPRKFGRNRDINLEEIVNAEVPVNTRINYSPVADAKKAASYCHASQGGREMDNGISGLLRGWSKTHEVFMRGYPEVEGESHETDLFDGIT